MTTSLNSTLSHNLRTLMERANISEHELSRRVKVAQPIIHRLLNGENTNPKLMTLKPIADYFMLNVSQLIGEENIDNVWKGMTTSSHHGWNEVRLINWEQANIHKNKIQRAFVISEEGISDKAFAFYIIDNLIEPLIPQGSVAIIDPNCNYNVGDLIALKDKDKNVIIGLYSLQKNKYHIHILKTKKNIPVNKTLYLGTVVRIMYDPRIKMK